MAGEIIVIGRADARIKSRTIAPLKQRFATCKTTFVFPMTP
jgi:hypothetical protein